MALFWDGNPSTQSFLKIVGLSAAPQLSPRSRARTSSRPASAPAREAHTTHAAHAYQSSSRHRHTTSHREVYNTANNNVSPADTGVSRAFDSCERPGVDSIDERGCVSFHDAADRYYRRDERERGRMRALGHRLRQLKEENARLHAAMLDTHTGWGSKRGVDDAQGGNLELIAALLAARKGAEKKSRRTQNKARILKVPLSTCMLLYLGSALLIRGVPVRHMKCETVFLA